MLSVTTILFAVAGTVAVDIHNIDHHAAAVLGPSWQTALSATLAGTAGVCAGGSACLHTPMQVRGGLLPAVHEYIDNASHTQLLLPVEDIIQVLLQEWLSASPDDRTLLPVETSKSFRLECGGYTTGGQDAMRVADNVFAVADGVGSSEVSPTTFTNALVDVVVDVYNEYTDVNSTTCGKRCTRSTPEIYDYELADRLYSRALNEGSSKHNTKVKNEMRKDKPHAYNENEGHKLRSASTLNFGFLSNNKRDLITVNTGDSGATVLRRSASCRWKRSTVMSVNPSEYAWNTPKQIVTNSMPSSDSVELYRFPLQEGDLIVAGSDGLLDNLYFDELDAIVSRAVSPSESVFLQSINRTHELTQFSKTDNSSKTTDSRTTADSRTATAAHYATPPGILAKYITLAARLLTASPPAWSPFTAGTLSALGDALEESGKRDDVAVTLCWVVSTSNQ